MAPAAAQGGDVGRGASVHHIGALPQSGAGCSRARGGRSPLVRGLRRIWLTTNSLSRSQCWGQERASQLLSACWPARTRAALVVMAAHTFWHRMRPSCIEAREMLSLSGSTCVGLESVCVCAVRVRVQEAGTTGVCAAAHGPACTATEPCRMTARDVRQAVSVCEPMAGLRRTVAQVACMDAHGCT